MEAKPAILVSYVALDEFLKRRKDREGTYRDWALDSGAYSALNSGTEINLETFSKAAYDLLDEDPSLVTVFALDVIGDPEASARNAEWMNERGVPAVPTFHYGSAWHYLEDMAKHYDRIAIGGLVQRGKGGHGTVLGWKDRLKFVQGCFARIWPKWVHGFGCTDVRLLTEVPFAATDSVSWYYAVARYGSMNGYSAQIKGIKKEGTGSAARVQVQRHLKLEDDIRERWKRIMDNAGLSPYALRLGIAGPELGHLEQ